MTFYIHYSNTQKLLLSLIRSLIEAPPQHTLCVMKVGTSASVSIHFASQVYRSSKQFFLPVHLFIALKKCILHCWQGTGTLLSTVQLLLRLVQGCIIMYVSMREFIVSFAAYTCSCHQCGFAGKSLGSHLFNWLCQSQVTKFVLNHNTHTQKLQSSEKRLTEIVNVCRVIPSVCRHDLTTETIKS